MTRRRMLSGAMKRVLHHLFQRRERRLSERRQAVEQQQRQVSSEVRPAKLQQPAGRQQGTTRSLSSQATVATPKPTIARLNRPTRTTRRASSSQAGPKPTTAELRDVQEIADSVGVRLTKNELTLLRQKLDLDGNGTVTNLGLTQVGVKALQEKTTRELCLSVICSHSSRADKWGVRVIDFFDYSGTALFSVVGTQVAGDSGMNFVGCCLVGCAAALGGGSINAILYGISSPLLAPSNGVRWVANPSYLVVAIAASAVTFFAWPYYCHTQANHYIENVIGRENLDENGGVGTRAFVSAWKRHPQFQQTIRDALPDVQSNKASRWGTEHGLMEDTKRILGQQQDARDAELMKDEIAREALVYFSHIDIDGSGDIDGEELEKLVQRRFHNGWETYWLDTFGLSALSIAAVVAAVKGGLHPIVAATSGVTVCFGGIMRDLLCGRDLAIGGQSYAMCTGMSSVVYILLRELSIRRFYVVPLVARTFMAFGTCVGLRALEFFTEQPLLRPMHGRYDSHSVGSAAAAASASTTATHVSSAPEDPRQKPAATPPRADKQVELLQQVPTRGLNVLCQSPKDS